MAEVVVQLGVEEASDTERLTSSLDAFAKWSDEMMSTGAANDVPEFMMTTVHNGECLTRRLIFQERQHAAKFLIFWRSERRRTAV